MEELKKIEQGTDNGSFDWILEHKSHATDSARLSGLVRTLVYKHNQMVDHINRLEKFLNEAKNELREQRE